MRYIFSIFLINATGTDLAHALHVVGRGDIIQKCAMDAQQIVDEAEQSIADKEISSERPHAAADQNNGYYLLLISLGHHIYFL